MELPTDNTNSTTSTTSTTSTISTLSATPAVPRPKNLATVEETASRLTQLLAAAHVCESHGINHARDVVRMVGCALAADPEPMDEEEELEILLAALLHDADDKKFFPMNRHYENAARLLEAIPGRRPGFAGNVIEMIKWVSASANRNEIPPGAVDSPRKLYPRHADRLAGIGWTGVHRCWQYTLGVCRPLFTPSTARAASEEDLWTRVATPSRYAAYVGSSESMIDHYYDKLLHIGRLGTNNAFFLTEARRRTRPMIDIALEFGRTGALDDGLYEESAVRAEKECQGWHE